MIEPDMNIITCFTHVKNTFLSLNQGKFAKFCLSVSFTLVDLKFLVQQSVSLTRHEHYNMLYTCEEYIFEFKSRKVC